MQRYSGFGLFKHSLSHHENWQKMWRTPTPKKVYDVVDRKSTRLNSSH